MMIATLDILGLMEKITKIYVKRVKQICENRKPFTAKMVEIKSNTLVKITLVTFLSKFSFDNFQYKYNIILALVIVNNEINCK